MTDYIMNEEHHKLMDRYRDVYNVSVYRCPTCGLRATGAAVTLHPSTHGPMIKEPKYGKES